MLESGSLFSSKNNYGMAIFAALSPSWRSLCAALTGVCALVLLAAPARADSLEEATRLLQAGQHNEALRQVDRYLATRPKDAQGRFLRGVILAGMNRHKEAIAVFERLTQDFPDLPEPHNNLAVIYAQQQQLEKAKEHLEKAIRTHPAYATAHENLGDIYSRLASQAYGRALQIDASNASAQTKLAMIDRLIGGAKVGVGGTAMAGSTANMGAAMAGFTTAAGTAPSAAPARPTSPAPTPPAAAPSVAPPAPAAATASSPQPAPVADPPAASAVIAPASPPEPPRPAAASDREVIAAVDAWLSAWSRKDVKAYLSHYARDFRVPGGQTRKDWEAERTQRITRPASISVTRDNLSVRMEGGGQAAVRFRQTYRAPGFSATTTKTLVMVREGDRWLIREERTP